MFKGCIAIFCHCHLQAQHSGAFSPIGSVSGGNAGSAFESGSGPPAFGAVSSVFGGAATLSPNRRRPDFSGSNPVHGRHSADPKLMLGGSERGISLGAPARASSSDLGHIGQCIQDSFGSAAMTGFKVGGVP